MSEIKRGKRFSIGLNPGGHRDWNCRVKEPGKKEKAGRAGQRRKSPGTYELGRKDLWVKKTAR